jgi:hypothetical protein
MSDYQFGFYERFRHKEIEDDKFAKRNKKEDDETMQQSSYRIKSRFACTMAFPEEIGNPYDSKVFEDKLEMIENLANKLDNFEVRLSKIEQMKATDLNDEIKEKYLELLEKEKDQHLDMKNGSLAKHSPKYHAMISNIMKERGKILVYSYFLNLIGLSSFSYALIQNANYAPFRIRKVNKMWELNEKEDEKGKNKYIFYSGNEDTEVREIYRKIYNSDWAALPTSCSKLVNQLKAIHTDNNYGEVIKMIMTTKTGAEGLDLNGVRYIHIMEPYWQHVLIDQIIGRGVRNKSHLRLTVKDRTVEVFIYMATITPNQIRKISYIDVRNDIYKYPNTVLPDKANKVVSSDEHLYLTAERKRNIISEFQKLMKETAFDCTLNYKENILNPANKGLVCMDYSTKNRDEYLYTPRMDDTVEGIELAQEKIVATQFKVIEAKGKKFYCNIVPNKDGKMYIYGENIVGRVRIPNPVGEVRIVNGKRNYVFYAKKKKAGKK